MRALVSWSFSRVVRIVLIALIVLIVQGAWAMGSVAHAQSLSIKPSSETPDPPASPEPDEAATESARSHFKLGVDFYRERNYRAALIEFQRAYADAPHYKLLYNLGQAALELQEYAQAIDYLTDYLREGGEEIPAERGAEVEQTIRYLESRIAYVSIATNEDGAELYVDDTLVGRSPLPQAVRVGAGRHKFSAVRAGVPPVERRLDIAAGEQQTVRLDFASGRPQPMPLAVVPVETYTQPEGSGSNTAAIVMGSVTGVLLAGAVTLTVLTGVAQESYQKELLIETTPRRLSDLRGDAETKALVTDVLWGATLASAVVTTVLLLTGGEESSRAERDKDKGLALRVGPLALGVDGRF